MESSDSSNVGKTADAKQDPHSITNYELTFPGPPEGRASLVHLKRLLLVGLSHYLYRRRVFGQRDKYMVIKNSSRNGKLFLKYMNSIGDALSRKRLKKVVVCLCPKNAFGAKPVEALSFSVRYALPSSTVVIYNVNGEPVNTISYDKPSTTRQQVMNLLKGIDRFTRKSLDVSAKYRPLIYVELFENGVEVGQDDYSPPLFISTQNVDGILSDTGSDAICFGCANFQEHACKITICQKLTET